MHTITTEEKWMEVTDESNQKVSVIDLHLEWCGPCNVIEPNFRSMYFNIDNAANRVEFWTAQEDIIPEAVKAKLASPLTSKPRF